MGVKKFLATDLLCIRMTVFRLLRDGFPAFEFWLFKVSDSLRAMAILQNYICKIESSKEFQIGFGLSK